MGKFRYWQGGASDLVKGVEENGDPLLMAAAAVIDEETKVLEKIEDFISRHGAKILRGELGLHQSDYDRRSQCDVCVDPPPNPSPPEEVAFLYDAVRRLDRSCDELIKLIEARVPNLPWLKKEGG